MDPFAPRQPTHEPMDFGAIMKLAQALLDEASEGPIAPETIDALAQSEGVDRAVAWAAAGSHPFIQLQRENEVAVAVCVGRCQLWGGGDLLEGALELREKRVGEGKSGFDVIPRNCLNRCHDAPMAFVVLPEGSAGFPRATTDDLTAMMAELDSLSD